MDWNLKTQLPWEWENLALFSGKESEMTKFATQVEWRAEDGGVISIGSAYSSGSGTSSGSDLGNGSSRSSISASVGSSSKIGVTISKLNFEAIEGLHQNPNKNNAPARGEDTGTSPVIVGRSGAGEPPIGLKLGKRTYFEDFGASNVKTSSVSMAPDNPCVKKSRLSHQATQNTYCQVEGCNIDLIVAKDYHRKHRVCENHSKSPKVIISGQERRFCQQCSRFHDLSEFDQKKRSCRKRLSEHNSRRRKPQPEAISFNSSVLPSSFYGNGQQMNFFLSRGPVSDVRPSESTLWEKSSGFSLSTTQGSTWPKPTKAGVDGALHLPYIDFSDTFPASHSGFNRTMPFKGTTVEVFNQGLEASVSASNLNGAPDLRRALSLLSKDSRGPCNAAGQGNMIQFARTSPHAASHLPLQASNSLPECWHDDHSLTDQALAFNFSSNGSQFQEFHLSKAPYDSPFFEGNQVFSKSDGHFLGFKA